ncbi:MAG TPA: phenylalanine--tRNA ligase subunit alpha, partial [Phaeodactylibacter sp.]|nr:phenylalanine--tRNA ligase subunit alpha [Phaeodactylibacter sp.]
MDLFKQVEALIAEIREAQPADAEGLEQFRRRFVGTKNVIKPFFAEIRNIEADKRKAFGQLLNEAKQLAEQKFETLKSSVAQAQEESEARAFDLTAPAEPIELGARHPVAIVMDRIIDIFSRIGFAVAEGPEIEDDWHNFTAMNTPEDHPARDMQDTYYVMNDPGMLLRTHTSSVQAHVMTTQKPPIRIIAPGRVYRNETISARAHCQFHQVEGLYIDEGVSFADMKQTLLYFARQMYGPDARIRLRPSFFPFTEPSAEMDVYWGLKDETDYRITKGTGWLEILGCGMVDPNVLEN